MSRKSYASLESQINNSSCQCEDTEEMFWLREADDYESKVKLGNLLSGQYRFREAIEAYHLAELIRNDEAMLYIRMGGAYLTLGYFDEAKSAYEKSTSISGNNKAILYPLGVWYYFKREYKTASEFFSKVLPCSDEMAIAAIYWNSFCCLRSNTTDKLIENYNDDMQVGHHTAYRDAVEVILGKRTSDEILKKVELEEDLNAVVAMYGVSVYLESCGQNESAMKVRNNLLKRKAVWPCISYLAAWHDNNQLGQ